MTYMKSLVPGRPWNTGPLGPMGDVFDELATFFGEEPAGDASSADPADAVNQTANGGTTTTAADFLPVGGVCKPTNFPALAMVSEFQAQLNRVAQVKGFAKIAVDGAIGPGTLALFRQVQTASAGAVMGDGSSCMGVAPDVDVVGAQIKAMADGLGAPANVRPALSIKAPTIVTKSGKTLVAPNAGIAGSLATMSGLEKVALLGVAGGIGYLLLQPGKRRKRGK
jgi:hypothetical protein